MGIGGALGAIGGGVLGIVGKVAGTGLKTLITGSALSGAITSLADDTLHNRKPSIPKAVIGAALGVGLTALLVGGQGLANKLMNPGQVAKPTVSSQKVDVQDGACFTAGTPVYTENGFTAIEKVKVGDKVHAYNPETGEKGLKQVNHIFVRETEELVKLNVGKAIIETTPTHPFWVVGNGWVHAGNLQTDDRILLYTGEETKVEEVDILSLNEPVKVYNFEVKDWHTYFVSEKNVLVHNACWVEPPGNGKGSGTVANEGNLKSDTIFSENALEHIFHGNINGRGRPSGYHHENINSEATLSNISKPDKFGVYEAIIELNGKQKFSTFFPKEWNRVQVLNAVKEAHSSLKINGSGWHIGTTKEGMEIKMWINDKGMIDTAFPIYSEK